MRGRTSTSLPAGGRVLNVAALGGTREQAGERAYQAVDCLSWPGMVVRRDIALKVRRRARLGSLQAWEPPGGTGRTLGAARWRTLVAIALLVSVRHVDSTSRSTWPRSATPT